MINVSGENSSEYQKTHFVFNDVFFESRAVYDIMWKNIVEPDGQIDDNMAPAFRTLNT